MDEPYIYRKSEHYEHMRFQRLYVSLTPLCETAQITMFGKTVESRRISCVFTFNEKGEKYAIRPGVTYDGIPILKAEDAPEDVISIKEYIEKRDNVRLDYVVCHIYRGVSTRETSNGPVTRAGQDCIGLHNDREALDTNVYSVSFGAPRIFNFRPLHDKNVIHESFLLHDGDEIHMVKSCQRLYKHEVPPMTVEELKSYITSKKINLPSGRITHDKLTEVIVKHRIEPDRINLTFRQYSE